MKRQEYLYAIIVRYDGSMYTQKICKYEEGMDVSKKLKFHLKLLGNDYYVADWYIDY